MQPIVDAMLADFSRDPRAALGRRPPKRDRDGHERDHDTLFSPVDLQRGRHVSGRQQLRDILIQPGRDHDVEDLVDHLEHHNLAAMDAARLRSAELAVAPWSDDYWPHYLGGLGQRYADPRFPLALDWARNHAHVQAHPVRDILASADPQAIGRLSPAEKYDLLVGDPDTGLTTHSWDAGRLLHARTGEVETWLGIGHGWAMASYGLPRPLHPVDTFAADGTPLRFYPADIKALASLLWAHADVRPRFTGGRGINPDTFHLALVNQLGVARRSLIADASHDHELWNQPIYAYHYELFNPQTLRHARTLTAARTPIAAYDREHVCRRRGPATAALVGVMMEVLYVRSSYMSPRTATPATPSARSVTSTTSSSTTPTTSSAASGTRTARPTSCGPPPRAPARAPPSTASCTATGRATGRCPRAGAAPPGTPRPAPAPHRSPRSSRPWSPAPAPDPRPPASRRRSPLHVDALARQRAIDPITRATRAPAASRPPARSARSPRSTPAAPDARAAPAAPRRPPARRA
jgi:hypothetical protein